MLSSGEVLFYPNPANDNITVSLNSQKRLKAVQFKAYKTSGEMVYNRLFAVESNTFETKIDVTHFAPGLYLFAVETEDGRTITRKVVVQ